MNYKSKLKDVDDLVIVATAIVFLVAGYDTTGSTLGFVCYELSKNQEIQDKLRAEVMAVLDEGTEKITYDDLGKMTYMDQVISETLRFHNPAAVLQRITAKDFKVPGTNFIIEKDIQVWVNSMSVHFNPKYYASPDVFDPEHFSKEAKAARNP